ncbi:MAG TPA: M50 family metallopeptidase [Longilinea sp.]|nr:M50 family metallopeptidase [Longilinea sp.]
MSTNSILMIVEFVVALSLLAGLHEFGHFLAARLSKIEVEEFGLGFPPRMLTLFKSGGTQFTLNWIPFGAFVRPKGENDPNVPGGMATANPWRKLAVLLGGPVMNLLIGVLVFSFIYSQVGTPNTKVVQILDVSSGSPAEQAGIQKNDVVLKVDGVTIDSMDQLRSEVNSKLGTSTQFTLLRDNQQVTVSLVPRVNPPEGQGAMGVILTNPVITLNWFQAVPYAISMTGQQIGEFFMLPVRLIQGAIPADQARLVSPVGMYDIYSQVRQAEAPSETNDPGLAVLNILNFFGFISIALGITNLLPIPAVDGGRILFVLPELILRKKVPQSYENAINAAGFTLLLLLMAFLFIQDIINPVVLR